MPVDVDFCCITNHQTLQSACLLVQTWEFYEFLFDVFPIGKRINQQAIVLVHSGHQLPVATGSDPLPVTGRNGQTPLGVQCDFGSPSKHGFCDGSGAGTDRAISALAHLLPLFSTFQHYIDDLLQRQPAVYLSVVVQGLRGYLMAKFGRIMAVTLERKINNLCVFLDLK